MSDFMEMGDSHLVATSYGYYNTVTGEKLDKRGKRIGKKKSSDQGEDRSDNLQD